MAVAITVNAPGTVPANVKFPVTGSITGLVTQPHIVVASDGATFAELTEASTGDTAVQTNTFFAGMMGPLIAGTYTITAKDLISSATGTASVTVSASAGVVNPDPKETVYAARGQTKAIHNH